MTMLMTLSILSSMMFMLMNHPLSMGSILLIQTIMVSMITGNFNQNFWFSYILFLIMVGGMLILFMYMTSIASNEKFKFNKKMIGLPLMMIPLIMMVEPYSKKMIMSNEMMPTNKLIELTSSMSKYINFPLSMIIIFMMMYLLIVLIATVKITNFKQGSLRQMN
uniref:NADH-ubiquinone oxidoreductase chain 6 n=1 Tax=Blaps rhynchoptera TaxID=1379410 RepID=A0A6H1XH19_BLARH|nr:NADH dehydrogenase subunit 6 [Blaps rhynchoptera]QJA14896.1 NADH dehydrogenase subunit 6 [Blaps rhynchoptera]QJA15166.1 NADH dehydrogenase subunit 6 [Blaps rhynchoptera]